MQRSSSTKTNALELLHEDHERVKTLFQDFEEAEDEETRKQIMNEAVAELKIHAAIEEEIFYPAVRRAGSEDLVEEAEQEHQSAREIIAELEDMEFSEGGFEEKFRELAREVQHHIEEEESQIFAQAELKELDVETLGQQMFKRKAELQEELGLEPSIDMEVTTTIRKRGRPRRIPNLER